MKPENHINDWEHMEVKNHHAEQKEEKIIQKSEDSLGSLWTTLTGPTFTLKGCQKEKRKSKKLKTYLKK